MQVTKKIFLQLSVIILISFFYDNADATHDDTYHASLSDYRLLGHVMKETKTADLLACTKECSHTLGCESLNYKLLGGICELNSAKHSANPLLFIKENGYIYYKNPEPKKPTKSKPYYKNCAKVKEANALAKSGLYEIMVNGISKQIYCDMENFDGGWSLAISISGTDKNHLLRTEHNCFNSSCCVPLAIGTLVARKLKDTDIHALADHEGTFRFDVTSATATLYTVFYRLSQGPQMFDAGCSGISCPRQIISHSYPYVWESNCKGIEKGYSIARDDCYKVFDGHDSRECNGIAWVSSQYNGQRVLYGLCSNSGIYSGKQGNMYVR